MKKQRKVMLVLHLIGATIIGVYIYSPFSSDVWLQFTVRFVAVPLISLTGLFLYKPKLLKR